MQRYLCIHGHFYQPPRENPWTERVEREVSAAPYHDWNERITAECYAPNAEARILDGRGRVRRSADNYRSISFNFGPTLLSWLATRAAPTYRAILDADRASRERFSGHGSAIAQAYAHPILPLASERDRRTQVVWGIRDFVHRFGREPEGLWLPETAADVPSLEVLAACGIRFTILAPEQAAATRPLHAGEWRDARGGRIDTGVPYLARLPSGREIALFFFDSALSRAVAFERLLADGDEFVQRMLAAFPAAEHGPRLVSLATDGETYGHHHRFGEMALAYAIDRIDRESGARLTNYGEHLARCPPVHEVRIVERSSWSCAHGLGRWSEDCGCRVGNPQWTQAWRKPLREALDTLRDGLAVAFEREAAPLLRDPWEAREAYIDVVLDRSPGSVDAFLGRHGAWPLDGAGRGRALQLLEMQRQTLLMYASCGWFFDDISGLESVQVLRHAGRALQLAGRPCGGSWEARFLESLEQAPSNLPECGTGRAVYERHVRPAAAASCPLDAAREPG